MLTILKLLSRDKAALIAASVLVVVALCAIIGPALFGPVAAKVNLRLRNFPPFSLEQGWLFVLGADALGRSLVARVIIAARDTMLIALSVVILSMLVGTALGLAAGLIGGRLSILIMRFADVLMGFPILLLALVVLYTLGANVPNVVFVIAVARLPIYLRTARAEVLEVRERLFVRAARTMGASTLRILVSHILPAIFPTIVTLATLEFALVMLVESSLSFLGLGIQPPGLTWGMMVSDGRNYLGTSWWLSFWPGFAIFLTAVSANRLAGWVRVAVDPRLHWRLIGQTFTPRSAT